MRKWSSKAYFLFVTIFSKDVCCRWFNICLEVWKGYSEWEVRKLVRKSIYLMNIIHPLEWFLEFVTSISINPFPHIDTFWRLCSRQLFENIVTKEEIAQNEQFLLLPQCFPIFVIGYPFNYRDFLSFDKICSKSSAAELSYEGKG